MRSRFALALALAGLAALAVACQGRAVNTALPGPGKAAPRAESAPSSPAQLSPSGSRVLPTGRWPSAAATRAENARSGSTGWQVGIVWSEQSPVEGFADHASVLPGATVRLFVRAAAPPVTVTAYRMGWYGGAGGRLVWTSKAIFDTAQPAARFVPATRTVTADDWHPSLSVDTAGWVPGAYLFHLADRLGRARWVPLTVRAPTAAGAVVLIDADTTWQAYDRWGGYSLYLGPRGQYAGRSYAVSFDRPYDYGAGAADFFGNELPVIELTEKLGLPDVDVTDTDIDADPGLLAGARAVVSLGHDEYWSAPMRAQLGAVRAGGTNVAFLGANAVYRHIRLGSTPLGGDRLETDYKDGALDPIARTDPAAATYQWRAGPDPRPESALTGAFYQCNGVHGDLVVSDAASWLFAGTGVQPGQRLAGLLGNEYDRVDLAVPTPRPMEVLFHSSLSCHGSASYADAVYFDAGTAGGFDAGTSSWVCSVLGDRCGAGRGGPAQTAVITQVTTNLLEAFAAGPAALAHPADDDLAAQVGGP